MDIGNPELLKAPYGGDTAAPHFLDATGNCCLGILERVWTGTVHGSLEFYDHEGMMAGCGKSHSRLIAFCVFTIWDEILFVH